MPVSLRFAALVFWMVFDVYGSSRDGGPEL
jgi:hypothetical protein